jgi:tetratricopeptide (TPR) repeat protein
VRAIKVFLETSRLDEAVDLLLSKRFFVAELEFGTRILYVRALLMRGSREFASGNFEAAAQDFRRATEYPDNLGASRFHDSADAQAWYLLGLALERLGRMEEARAAWETSAADTPVRGTEQAYYVAMSRKLLVRTDADDAFDLIIPDAAEPPKTEQEKARRHYLTALAASDESTAQEHFRAAMTIERTDPVKMHNHLDALAFTRVDGRRHPIAVWWTDGGMADGCPRR